MVAIIVVILKKLQDRAREYVSMRRKDEMEEMVKESERSKQPLRD